MLDRAAFRRSATWYQLQVRGRRLFNRVPVTESQKVYILTLLIGVICGLAAVAFHCSWSFSRTTSSTAPRRSMGGCAFRFSF